MINENFENYLLENISFDDIFLDYSMFGKSILHESEIENLEHRQYNLNYSAHSKVRIENRVSDDLENVKDFCNELTKERFAVIKDHIKYWDKDILSKSKRFKFFFIRKKIEDTYYAIVLLPAYGSNISSLLAGRKLSFMVITVIVRGDKRPISKNDINGKTNTELKEMREWDIVVDLKNSTIDDPVYNKFDFSSINKTIVEYKLNERPYIS